MEAKRIYRQNSLHPDQWTEILARCPSRTLLKLRCICKTWCSIIDSPEFAYFDRATFDNNSNCNNRFLVSYCVLRTHWDINLDTPLCIFNRRNSPSQFSHGWRSWSRSSWLREQKATYHRYKTPIFNALEFSSGKANNVELLWNSDDVRVSTQWRELCYVDGLVLISWPYIRPNNNYTLSLWNPSIQKRMVLPPIPCEVRRRPLLPSLLGYDRVSNDYKVVVICKSRKPRTNKLLHGWFLAVYSLKFGSWRLNHKANVYKDIFSRRTLRKSSIVNVKEVAYWVAIAYDGIRTKLVNNRSKTYTHIVSFDFASEPFSCIMMLPEGYSLPGKTIVPFKLGDSLAIFSISRVDHKSYVYVLKENGDQSKSWSLQYASGANLPRKIHSYFIKNKTKIKVISYSEKDHKLVFFNDSCLISYDLERHEIKKLHSLDSYCHVTPDTNHIHPYFDSLQLHKPFKEIQTGC